jgi:predicted dienelactone hydrolase
MNRAGRAVVALALASLFALVAVACSSDGKSSPTATPTEAPIPSVDAMANRGQYGVGVTTFTMVDTSRPTAANHDAPASPERTMDVEVWYPARTSESEGRDAALDASGGPYPLIIFAHGLSAFRRQSVEYTTQLASHGYIVASPGFPQSRLDSPGGPRIGAVLDQPGDVSFVIDELLKMDSATSGLLSGAIDESRIGMTGHSLGGLTTLMTAHGAMRDDRIKVIAPISPVACMVGAGMIADTSIPIMIIGGSDERIVEPETFRKAYEEAVAPKYYAEIIGADHTRFADVDISDEQLGGSGVVDRIVGGDIVNDSIKVAGANGANAADCIKHNPPADPLLPGERQRELLRIVATPFFDAYLKGDAGARRFLTETLPTLEGIRFQAAP